MSVPASPPAPVAPATVASWQACQDEVAARLAPCVPCPETRRRLQAYLDGLLSDTRRKNGWQLAETVGDATPYGFQHLLGRAAWSVDQARDALYAYVGDHLGDAEGVVVIDETGFPKQGTHSAGVARQYCGALGKIGNCQVGVCLAYAGTRGHTLLDRELYLPAAWTDHPARLQAVGLAPDTPFATKPQLAQRMLARVRDAGLPVAWVTGDTVYGRSTDLRRWLEDRGQHHVLAVPRNESLWVGRDIWTPEAVHAVHAGREWYRLSAGAGSKGERWNDWPCWVLAEPEDADWGRYLLFRRSLADPDAWQAYVAFAPQGCDLERLVAVAGRRWCIEHAFEAAKQEVGLATTDRVGDPCGSGGGRRAVPPRGARPQGRARVRVAVAPDGEGDRRGRAPPAPRVRSLRFQRSCTDPDDGTADRVYAPRDTALDTVVRVAGTRPTVPPRQKSPRTAWWLSSGPAGCHRPEPGGRAPVLVATVVAHRPHHRPLAGLVGLEAGPHLDGPMLPLPAARTTRYFTTVVLAGTTRGVTRARRDHSDVREQPGGRGTKLQPVPG